MPNTPTLNKGISNEQLAVAELNKTDFYLIVYDDRWVPQNVMVQLAQNLTGNQIHFTIIPIGCAPIKAINVAGAITNLPYPKEGYLPASKEPKDGAQ